MKRKRKSIKITMMMVVVMMMMVVVVMIQILAVVVVLVLALALVPVLVLVDIRSQAVEERWRAALQHAVMTTYVFVIQILSADASHGSGCYSTLLQHLTSTLWSETEQAVFFQLLT